MIKLENTEVVGWEHAIRGMRNPMNSWEKSDSKMCPIYDEENYTYLYKPNDHPEGRCAGCKFENTPGGCIVVGENDHKLMMSLAKGGPVHAKYRRMITVYVDITAPLYWWKEFDTYKVGTVTNSCSTMHKIHEKEFTLEDFSHEHLIDSDDICNEEFIGDDPNYAYSTPIAVLDLTIETLNRARHKYFETKTKPMKDESKRAWLMKRYWWQMIQLLPTSYNQKRTVMLNYEVLNNIYHSRKNHKLDEWHVVCDWIRSLPYSEIITGEEE